MARKSPPKSRPDFPGDCSSPVLMLASRWVITSPIDQQRLRRNREQYAASGLTDYYFATDSKRCAPDGVFQHLRWGGQVLFVSPRRREVEALLKQYRARPEYRIEIDSRSVALPWFGIRMLPDRRHFGFVARKVLLASEREVINRHSFDVRLVPSDTEAGRYDVLKQVPERSRVLQRLCDQFPETPRTVIEDGAHQLVDRVFPIFLTREAAFLKLLQRDLPPEFRCRVPSILSIEKDERGLVQKMTLDWLRLGGKPISLLDFAIQSAQLLVLLHEKVGAMHLDLRLDNLVITEHGVGFVDFGSAVRLGEDFSQNAVLKKIFDDLLPTSQVYTDLRHMLKKGTVTSSVFANVQRKLDPAIDLFYLALQMNRPHKNPDFKGLVDYDARGEPAARLGKLSQAIFQPADPARPRFRSARDLVQGINQIISTS